MSNVFEALAPRGPIKTGDDKWDVFLSYRSVSRPWVLRLYDQLRHLDYEVFMDQFVLTTSGGLNPQLEQNLQRSATAVLIWSSRSEESQWCRDEYDALRMQEKAKSGFRYVVLRVDETELPTFAQTKLWIDFSSQPDGPTGTGLLRLLHGLHDKPLSDEAVRMAAAYDEAVQRALAKIGAARANGDPDTLLELVKSDAPEWTTTSMLPCKVVQALIALDRPADAVPLLDALMKRFPRSVRPQQLMGLALARQGKWRAAQQVLGELHELGERDPETLGILARTWRDRFAESGDLLHLRKARNLYAEAFESTPSDYYSGVNAAANSVLLDEPQAAETLALAVEKLVGVAPLTGDYWATASAAEAQLILGRFAAARKLYAAAVEDDPEAKGSHASTLAQARRLMDKLHPSAVERATIEKAFGG
jgi:tetratricopeptide (TPR) repeat protein